MIYFILYYCCYGCFYLYFYFAIQKCIFFIIVIYFVRNKVLLYLLNSLMGNEFIKQLLDRVASFHQLLVYGKIYTLAKETAEELNLPFTASFLYAPH